MDVITLEAGTRKVGKGGARAVRREGNVPCVLYGHHVEPVAFHVPELSLKPLIYTTETHLVKISLGKDAWECIVKDIDFHPVTDRPIHADFQVLQEGEPITLIVPVRYVGVAKGQTAGGRVNHLVHELEVTCLPKDIPSQIDVDVTDVGIGDAIHVRDLNLEELTINAPAELTLVNVKVKRGVEEEVEEGEEGEVEATSEEA